MSAVQNAAISGFSPRLNQNPSLRRPTPRPLLPPGSPICARSVIRRQVFAAGYRSAREAWQRSALPWRLLCSWYSSCSPASVGRRSITGKVWCGYGPRSARLYGVDRTTCEPRREWRYRKSSCGRGVQAECPTLSVSGKLVNVSDRDQPIPRLRVVLLDDSSANCTVGPSILACNRFRHAANAILAQRCSSPPPDAAARYMSAWRLTMGDEGARGQRTHDLQRKSDRPAGQTGCAVKSHMRPARPEIAMPILVGAFVFAADLLRELARHGLTARNGIHLAALLWRCRNTWRRWR